MIFNNNNNSLFNKTPFINLNYQFQKCLANISIILLLQYNF